MVVVSFPFCKIPKETINRTSQTFKSCTVSMNENDIPFWVRYHAQ
jgi:hypothetical protein